jgi:hypothetical protein
MANVKGMQEEAMASIDTAKAMVDKVVAIMTIMLSSPSLSLNFATNPIGFLLQILKHLGITYEEIRLWLTKFLIYVVPLMEISVKAILLTNLKNMISCSVDPRIPEKYRKRHKGYSSTDYSQTSQEYGIDINIESIDFLDKLSVNPLSDYGSEMYFGLFGVDDVYKFARADDFDAFLWFVIHRGKFPNSTLINKLEDLNTRAFVLGEVDVTPSDGSLLSTVDVLFKSNGSGSQILLGNTFAYKPNTHVISMCIDRQFNDANSIIHNTLVPVSDDWSSVNWYARPIYQFGKNLGFGWSAKWSDKTATTRWKKGTTGRKYNKEKALCNLQYIDQASSTAPITGLVNNKFRFTILPKPYIHIPNISKGEPPWRFKKMLFNDKGEYDSNGKYTFAQNVTETIDGDNVIFTSNGVRVYMNLRSGKVTVGGPAQNIKTEQEKLVKEIMECYPGLTVFEFNYDYVMSIKLFDPKVLATSLLDALINARMGINLSFNAQHQEASDIIKEILKNIIESDDSSVNDCYYKFDNSKYESLLRKSEEKRARQERFGNVTHGVGSFENVRNILSEYSENAELQEQIDILQRAITQAAVTVSDGVAAQDKYDVEYNFVFDLIENLVTAIVNGILSPKILLLLEVNQKIMGGTWEKFTMRDLIEALETLITSIIKEVRDLVIQELLKLVLSQLEPIIEMLGSLILREQLDNYAEAIMEIIRNCPFIWFRFGNRYEDTKLDTVDYADIDVSEIKDGEKPDLNNC